MTKDLVYVAGHRGLVGSAIARRIEERGTQDWVGRTRSELDLLDRRAVFDFVTATKPDAIVVAAAKVGGIKANSTYPVEFLTENVQMQSNLMDAAHASGVERLLFLGSSCIYPKFAEQPIREDSLLTGPLEPTNDAYAIAKIAGIRLADGYRSQYGRDWISAMPTNIYGPGDNFDLETSHVLPALIHRFHDAKQRGAESVTLWGSGVALREFLFSEDLAEASLFLLDNYHDPGPINVGFGEDISIRDLADVVSSIVGYEGAVEWDSTKPDGTPRKILDSSK
ncbi:MAG: GDP-L-fucose synthase, partial [Rhodoglobus sp.]|nr:GDP-L-fucose synthase [Rhodoglobus sp.]